MWSLSMMSSKSWGSVLYPLLPPPPPAEWLLAAADTPVAVVCVDNTLVCPPPWDDIIPPCHVSNTLSPVWYNKIHGISYWHLKIVGAKCCYWLSRMPQTLSHLAGGASRVTGYGAACNLALFHADRVLCFKFGCCFNGKLRYPHHQVLGVISIQTILLHFKSYWI